jgi:hypothetical protein
MKTIILLAVIGALTMGGWAWAREQQMLNHLSDVNMQKMDDASCSSSSSSSGGQ